MQLDWRVGATSGIGDPPKIRSQIGAKKWKRPPDLGRVKSQAPAWPSSFLFGAGGRFPKDVGTNQIDGADDVVGQHARRSSSTGRTLTAPSPRLQRIKKGRIVIDAALLIRITQFSSTCGRRSSIDQSPTIITQLLLPSHAFASCASRASPSSQGRY